MGKGALADVLEKLFRQPRQPTEFHHAVARLAKAGYLSSLITTNYDELLEDALKQAGAEHMVQTLERNQTLGADTFRVLKLHGGQDDWTRAILSGEAYGDFQRRYDLLCKQFDVLLRQRWVLFAGCSMTDPRIFEWLEALPAEAAAELKPWRPMMTANDWEAAVAASQAVKGNKHPLVRGNIRPLVLASYAHLPALWKKAAARRQAVSGAGQVRAGSEVTAAPQEPEPVNSRLEELYRQREERIASGGSVAEIDAEILKVRREMRQGPALNPGEYLREGRYRLLEGR